MSTTSPMMLAVKPKRAKGVRRLNRMPVYIGAGAIGVVILIIAYTYHQRMARQQQQVAAADTGQTQGAGAHAKDFFNVSTGQPVNRTRQTEQTMTPAAVDPARTMTAQTTDLAAEARQRAWAQYYQKLAAQEQAKDDATVKAMSADTETDVTASGAPSGSQTIPAGGGVAPVSASSGLPVAGVDSGAQAEKRAFLAQGGDPLGMNEDLLAGLHGPKLDTVMQGTAISGVMIGGLISDMPGQIIGSVSENIYDTATGNDLLIPQGSRVVGSYDNSVSNGQERIGVIWQRIIFPDTSSIQLGSMEGADQGGYAGFHDQVNTHFWEKFASATIISIAGAGAQLAQPQQSAFSGYSPTSVASGQLTQGYSQLGQEYAKSGLSIPNTLSVRPGYAFTIMVAKDMHLPVYADRRNIAATKPAGPILQ